jgi:hypothetical protein
LAIAKGEREEGSRFVPDRSIKEMREANRRFFDDKVGDIGLEEEKWEIK